MANYHITCSYVNDFNRQENPSATNLLRDSNTKIFNPHYTNETTGEYIEFAGSGDSSTGSGGFPKETTNALYELVRNRSWTAEASSTRSHYISRTQQRDGSVVRVQQGIIVFRRPNGRTSITDVLQMGEVFSTTRDRYM